MTKDKLIRIGTALYGERWQTDLAKALLMRDARAIRQWLSGERKIPVGLDVAIDVLIEEKIETLNNIRT